MVRDAGATRRRILDAAEEEFSRFGIAGARVDRIAESAEANKAMIYRYFVSKDALFEAVFSQRVVSFVEEVHFDATDLPGYAGRAFDLYEDSPRTLRLTTWYMLERPAGAPLEAIVASNRAKLEGIERAQRDGALSSALSPLELLTEVRALSMSWHLQTPELSTEPQPDRDRRRAVVAAAVRRLVDVTPDQPDDRPVL